MTNFLADIHAATADLKLEAGDMEGFVESIENEIEARGGL